jgi:ribosome biogenesis GTPase / thiamine phosphate phosphatase
LPEGIVVKGIGGFYYISSESDIFECRARGIFRKNGVSPMPGDRVVFEISDPVQKTGSLDEIMPRKTMLDRPAVANADQLLVVLSVHSPEPDYLLSDRLLVQALKQDMDICICINKLDIDTDNVHKSIADSYAAAGFNIISASSITGEGFDDIAKALKGRITVLAGQSGVGKSTILNRIMESYVMETGALSQKLNRGRHTTRHAELLILADGGYVADTPGFSSFSLQDMECGELQYYYPEFLPHIGKCKFTGCSHISEPGCDVKKALEEGFIDPARYERYTIIYDELKNINNQWGRKGRK